jgi:potassium-transporting ATPase potassium-binding subunit
MAVFVAGLMVGRTPEYLGKKIEAREVKLAVLAILVRRSACWASRRRGAPPALASVQDAGPARLLEILYAYSSAAGNNGSPSPASAPRPGTTRARHRHAARRFG